VRAFARVSVHMSELTETSMSQGRLFLEPDVDAAREFFRTKSREMKSKLMSVSEAVSKFCHDGDYLASGGFGTTRIATAVLHEIVRQGRRRLGFAGHTTTHDFQILAAGHCIDRCDVAYFLGLEMRGMSPNSRRAVESGAIELTEWTNASLDWRFKAAAMGVPFLPARTVLGTDVYRFSAAKEILCPFTGQKFLAVPALFPDVGIIHVHRADQYGNAQVDGITMADRDIARCAKRLIISTERLVSSDEIRTDTARTLVPYWQVDAVCHVPYGSYPGNMPYEYYSDEEHLSEWFEAEKDPETFKAFMKRYIYDPKNFSEYLALKGGEKRIAELREQEPLKRV
jgi:glutaconate CoA-transferase, subunit A